MKPLSGARQASPSKSAQFRYALLALNIFIGLFLYSNTFQSSFHFDGIGSIRDNPLLSEPYSLFKTCGQDNITRCLTHISFALNYRLHGTSVFGYHAVNTALHLGSSLLVFALVWLLFQTPRMAASREKPEAGLIAWCASLIFLCHPIQTQAVAYIWQRFASLAAFFYFLTLVFYLYARLRAKPAALVFAGVSMLAALFSKETAATLPLMILLTELLFFEASSGSLKFRRFLFLTAGGALLIVPCLVLFSGKLAFYLRPHFYYGYPTAFGLDYFWTQMNVVVFYLKLIFWPQGLNFDHDFPIAHSFFETRTLLSAAILSGAAAAGWFFRARQRIVFWSVLWFFITLSIECGLIPIRDVIFEHRLYLPMAGVSALASIALFHLCREPKRYPAAVFLLITVLSILTYQRNNVWRSEITLWEDVLQKSPHKPRGYSQLCLAWKDEKRFDAAIPYCEKALQMNPQNGVTFNNLGAMYGQLGKTQKAERCFKKAIALSKRPPADRDTLSRAYSNLGNLRFSKGKPDEALLYYDRALFYDPLNTSAHFNQGIAALKTGRVSLASAEYKILLGLNAFDLAEKLRAYLDAARQKI